MTRKIGNPQQEAALERFLSAFATTRNIVDVQKKFKTALTTTHLWVKVEVPELPDFPLIRIGGRGGFEMPDIRTHPSPPDERAANAFEACIWGDWYVQRQGDGAARTSAFQNLPWEPI